VHGLHGVYVQLLLIKLVPILNRAQTRRKHDFQELRVILHSFYIQQLLIKHVSSLNMEV